MSDGHVHRDRVSISDVAKLAGVSQGTVSRTLNNIGYVNAGTREKVKKAVDALGYVPNHTGRVLKTSRTGLVMMAIPDNSNEVYFGMVKAFQAYVTKHGYSMLLFYTEGQHDQEMKALDLLRQKVVDGLYMVHFSYQQEMHDLIDKMNAPIVLNGMCCHLWAGKNNPFDTISIDVYKGIWESVEHLIRMGHRRIGYLAGIRNAEVYAQRYRAYLDVLKKEGIEPDDSIIRWNEYTRIGGYNSARSIVQNNSVTAICASNDLQAIGCWEAMEDLGIRIPEQIALTGLDNLEISEILGITSLNMKESAMGNEAARLLMERINGGEEITESRDIYFQPELVVRKSSLK